MNPKRTALLLLLALITATFSASAFAAVKIYCPFESGSGTELCEKSSSHSSFSVEKGSGVEFKSGYLGNAVEIESDNDILVLNDVESSFPMYEGSVGFWIKPLDWTESGGNNLLFYANSPDGDTALDNLRIHYSGTATSLGIDNPSLTFSAGHIDWGDPSNNDYDFTMVDISDWFDGGTIKDEWHHIGFSWKESSGRVKAFVDFEEKDDFSGGFSFITDNKQMSEMRIGTFNGDSGVVFPADALFDELRVYNEEIDFEGSRPEITDLEENIISDTSAEISFNTSVSTEPQIKYWRSGGSVRTKNLSSGTTHSATLDSLESGRTYNYTISACNSAGLCGNASGDFSLSECSSAITCVKVGSCISGRQKLFCTDSKGCVEDYNTTESCTITRECTRNSDCTGGKVCELNHCVEPQPECVNDADCDAGEECGSSGSCVAPQPECVNDSQCGGTEKCSSGGECVAVSCPSGQRAENHRCVSTCSGTVCGGACQTGSGACCSSRWNEGFESCRIDKISELEGLSSQSESIEAADFLSKAQNSERNGLLAKGSAEADIGIAYANVELAKKNGKKIDKALAILSGAETELSAGNYAEASRIAGTYGEGIEDSLDLVFIGIAGIIILAILGVAAFFIIRGYRHTENGPEAEKEYVGPVVGNAEEPAKQEKGRAKRQEKQEEDETPEEEKDEVLEKLKESLAKIDKKKETDSEQ